MNKQKILELTGLSEDQFYDQYPDQETFCSDYPEACNQLEEAQGGMQVGKVYDKYGNETFTPAPDPIHSDWQINDEGMNVRPRTVDRFGNPIGPTTQVLRIPVDRVPFNREPTMQRLNPAMQSLQNASPNNVPTTSPIDILTPLIARYSLPKGMVQNSIPIEKLSAKQTMQQVGSTGAPYSAPVNKYESIVDLLNSKKMDSSMSSRKKLAEEYDISNYTGTSTQNKLLLDKINNLNEVNKVNNTPSINQINNEDYNYLAPSEEKQILNKFIPTKYPNINDVSTRYNSALNNKPLINVQPTATKIVPTENPYYKNYIYNAPKTLPCYGKGCAKSVSDELESMGLQPQRTNSWFMRDKVIKNGGAEIWNKNSNKNIDYKQLHIGDIVSMDRPGLHYEDEMKNNNPEKLNSEHNEHVGVVVGFAPNGEALIKHGGQDENTVVQPFSKLQLKNNVTGAILNYKPNSIYRVKGADKAQLKKEYTDYNYNYKPGMESPTKSSFFDYAKNRLGFEQGGTAIFPSMRNFQGGGTSYSNFLNKVGNPEMIQSDNIRSEYVPKTNTIYYDLPRSIPDELGHAYQRSIGNIGYSVPPNQNTMMKETPEMQDVYSVGRSNLDPKLVSNGAGLLNTIREKNVPNDSNNSLANSYIRRYFPGDEFAGDSYLNKINDRNIYFIPGSGEFGAHQIYEPSIRNDFFDYRKSKISYKQGGYYGMDQKFHPNSDSGTYVTGAGYYFQGGGPTASPASAPGTSGGVDVSGVPGAGAAGADGIRADGSFLVKDSKMPDGGYDGSGMMMDDSASEQSSPFDYNNSQFSEQSANKEQPYDQQQQPPVYDASQYSSEIDPSTGFTKYKKNGLAIRNIKREDPTLWNHLKDEGHGARWATGQTDFQRVGRTAGAIGQGLEAGINVAGAIGGYLNNRNKQRNMDKSAINMGSTASMFTNPQGSGKGDYGVTGSTYGQFKPNQGGNMSFKGMYGKYGMQVPSYQSGGGFSNLFASAQSTMPVINPLEYTNNISTTRNYPVTNNIPVNDNTRVASPVVPLEIREQQTGPLNVDLALQAVSGHESGVKPGQTKVGFRTRLVGEGGKRASASGTYQITTGTLQQIYKNDKNINSAFNTFNQFKSAFDTDPKVEYAAAKSLMSDHIKNYGVYALGAWYQPTFAKRAMEGDKSVFNIIPRKDYGNKLKWGTDFKNKLNSYNKLAGTDYEIMKYGGQQQGGQVVDMDENQIQQFLAAGGQLEFLD